MSILNKLKDAMLKARKSRNEISINLLVSLYSEASMIGKNNGNRDSTDAEAISVMKKFIKGIDENLTYIKDEKIIEKLNLERKLISDFLPKQLNEEDIKKISERVMYREKLNSPKQVGIIMKEFKSNYDGQYDGKLVSQIAKEVLCHG